MLNVTEMKDVCIVIVVLLQVMSMKDNELQLLCDHMGHKKKHSWDTTSNLAQ